ncbi:MAG: hypothetical protein Q8S11_15840 [Daejeonella sp.]|uniref:hypothetical protein n=1 Tax=Daejeonella sp. TaxID=2805397 RepID=UPI0027366E19|nr:hypothetical protein [Daejeonella sp.]MDP3469813.1 hypothetical protein [Daejeonella sp.]
MVRRILLVMALSLAVNIVYAQKGKYIAILTKVEVGSNVASGSISENGIGYQDSLIAIDWNLGSSEYNFVLQNKSQQTIKIIWDETAYIGPDGETGKVFHQGVKYIDRNNSQVPTSIIKGSKLSDLIAPTDLVYYNDSRYSTGWTQRLLYGYSKKAGPVNDGATAKILLPISTGDKTIEYIFEFKITWEVIQRK